MGDGAGLERRRSLLLVLLLMLSLISTTQAQGGAVLIDETSFSLLDGTTVTSKTSVQPSNSARSWAPLPMSRSFSPSRRWKARRSAIKPKPS